MVNVCTYSVSISVGVGDGLCSESTSSPAQYLGQDSFESAAHHICWQFIPPKALVFHRRLFCHLRMATMAVELVVVVRTCTLANQTSTA
jgi:hypothetical protein